MPLSKALATRTLIEDVNGFSSNPISNIKPEDCHRNFEELARYEIHGRDTGKGDRTSELVVGSTVQRVVSDKRPIRITKKIRELEEKLKNIGDWEHEKGRYALVSPWKGPAQVYALKQAAAEGEDPHFLCTNCFHDKKKVILNPITKTGWVHMVCPACKADLATGYRGIGQPKYAEEYLENG